MTLEEYLGDRIEQGIISFYLDSEVATNGEITFYIRPIDCVDQTGHFAVTGNLLEPIELDNPTKGRREIRLLRLELEMTAKAVDIRGFQEDIKSADIPTLLHKTRELLIALDSDRIIKQEKIDNIQQEIFQDAEEMRSELGRYAMSLGINYVRGEDDNTIPALLQEARHTLTVFNSERATESQKFYQIENELKYLKTEVLKHESTLGLERENTDDFNVVLQRARTTLVTYKRRLLALEDTLSDTIKDLDLVSQCEPRLNANDWTSSTFGCIQMLTLKVCSLCAARLRRSIESFGIQSKHHRDDEF